ncbi:MAG: ribonuclease P protein component [bacterium]|nr:ribonuclease P protein component [bacterium]
MLAKKYRLPIQSVVKKSGQTARSRYFLLKFFPNQLEFNRIGVIISKKVAKGAVVRNKIKRTLFNSLKEFVKNGSNDKRDFLIIVSPQAASLNPEELKKEIQAIFKNY